MYLSDSGSYEDQKSFRKLVEKYSVIKFYNRFSQYPMGISKMSERFVSPLSPEEYRLAFLDICINVGAGS